MFVDKLMPCLIAAPDLAKAIQIELADKAEIVLMFEVLGEDGLGEDIYIFYY